ncbi:MULTISPECIES: GOLPH3/VPS74 family protein [Streptomyces]|uniref:GPP34 family phosphoprotein n=1 Tax=Streptomyces yangpuensis TaxID=1648182 RepID=A0ABY5Q3L9_9ACTN|nr:MULTISPECIES: GPP34 family phosphoprotein [Streptomyces]UUY50815.1 GPP34 family phosphoprotein [Streptomyces yangpuensis]
MATNAGLTITLAEEIMLLSLDDESGTQRQRQSVAPALSGAILIELVLAERVSVSGKHMELRSTEPTGDPLLDGRLRLMEPWLRGRRRRMRDWLTKDYMKVAGPVLERLGERKLVAQQVHKVLGVFPQRRYPEVDGTVERALRERLAAVVLGGVQPDERTAGLIALLHAAKLHRLAFPQHSPGAVKPRMAEIADGQWAAEGVRAAIRDMQAAMVTMMAATVVAVS